MLYSQRNYKSFLLGFWLDMMTYWRRSRRFYLHHTVIVDWRIR